MKNNNLLFIAIIFLFLSITKIKAQTVYVTESGIKYHAKNCNIVKTGKKGMELSAAKKAGYEACKSCKAGDTKIDADKPKEKKAKK